MTTKTKRKRPWNYYTCRCGAYKFPHRMNGGKCSEDFRQEEAELDRMCGPCGGSGGGEGYWRCPYCAGSGENRPSRYSGGWDY